MAKNPRLIDMTARQCGDWTVLRQNGNNPRGQAMWLCRCKCGAERTVGGADLRKGTSTSCGCRNYGMLGQLRRTHGETGTRLYVTWQNMRRRCETPGGYSYQYYGGRGIRVCDEWQSFEAFREWAVGSGYADNLTIDRIDNDKGYTPDNCRWADKLTQSRNRRFVERVPDGRAATEAAEANGIPARTYRMRRSMGWSVERATTQRYWSRENRDRDVLGRFT